MEPESEIEALRGRVSRLEAQVAALQSSQQTPAVSSPPPLQATQAEPPVLAQPASAASEVVPPILPVREAAAVSETRVSGLRPEASSTVWIAAAGGVIFLLGAIYALTLSIQRGWLSAPVRVGLGVVVGLGLGAAAGRLILHESRRLGVALLVAGLGTFVFALHFGAARAELYPLGLGFAGTVAATLCAGGLASRVRSGGAMAVAVVLAVLAPLIFSSGRRALVALMGYYLVVLLAQAASYHLGRTGAQWRLARWLGLVPIALLGALAAADAGGGDRLLLLALLPAVCAASLWIVWLPRHPERPGSPVALTSTLSLALTAALYFLWGGLGWPKELFALPLLAQAVAIVLLVPAARRRLDEHSADTGLVLLAAVYLLLAVPVAAEPRWFALIWGAMAFAAALGSRAALRQGRPDADALWLAAAGMAATAGMRWFIAVQRSLPPDLLPFFNPDFVGALLTAAAWGALARESGGLRRLIGVVALQVILINALAFEWMGRRPIHDWDQFTQGTLLATLTYALAGVGQWYAGMQRAGTAAGRRLRIAGYVWLGVAAAKLILGDLARAPTEWKAIATLGIGALLIGAALLANRIRRQPQTGDASP